MRSDGPSRVRRAGGPSLVDTSLRAEPEHLQGERILAAEPADVAVDEDDVGAATVAAGDIAPGRLALGPVGRVEGVPAGGVILLGRLVVGGGAGGLDRVRRR